MSTSQKQLVFVVVTEVFRENGIKFEEGKTDARKLVKAHSLRKIIISGLVDMCKTGEMVVESDKARADLSKYCAGLLTNHLRKDKRLNGGENYKPTYTNPGHSDPAIRAMREVIKGLTEPDKIAAFQAEIDRRIAEKAKAKVEINLDCLPEHLRKLVA